MSSASTPEMTARSSTLVNKRDLAALLVGQRILATAQQHVGLDTDAAQLLDAVLGGLGLDLARAANNRHQGEMQEHAVVAAEFDAELANRLEEGQGLDVTDGAADFHHADVGIAGAELDGPLDLVGDVRDHLHGGAQVVAATFLGDHALVDTPSREIAVPTGGGAHEALVVAEIEVALGAVVGDEHLAVLKRAHGARIHVDVGIELYHRDFEAAGFEDCAKRCGGNSFPQRGNHATGDEHESGHEGSRRKVEKFGSTGRAG